MAVVIIRSYDTRTLDAVTKYVTDKYNTKTVLLNESLLYKIFPADKESILSELESLSDEELDKRLEGVTSLTELFEGPNLHNTNLIIDSEWYNIGDARTTTSKLISFLIVQSRKRGCNIIIKHLKALKKETLDKRIEISADQVVEVKEVKAYCQLKNRVTGSTSKFQVLC